MRITLFHLILSAAVVTVGTAQLAAADNCDQACELYTVCTGKAHGKTLTADERKTLKGGCMVTCGKKTQQVIACYTSAKAAADSCSTLQSCIIKAHQGGK